VLVACTQFCEVVPNFDPPAHPRADDRAWRCMDELIFNDEISDVPGSSPGVWDRLLREFPEAAVDVIYQLWHATIMGCDSVSVYEKLLRNYPNEVRSLLEWGLKNRESLTSFFVNIGTDRRSRDTYIVETLGVVGNAATSSLLKGYVADSVLGEAAVKAIRTIDACGLGTVS
jgi:hypothetical protein